MVNDPRDPGQIPTEPIEVERRPNGGKHRKRAEWDPRAVLSLIVIVGAFGLAVLNVIADHPRGTIPAWVAALIGGIGLYYYRDGKDRNGKD